MTRRRALGIALAASVGLSVSTQARINGELAVRLGDGVAAAVISFGTGLVLLAVLVPLFPAGRRGLRGVRDAVRAGPLRWWECLGGVFGGFVVASQGVTVPVLGVAVFTVAVVAGQAASSLAVDRAGLGPASAERVTAARLVGAALCVLAVLVAVGDRLGTPRALGLAVLPLLAGVGVAWQLAVNGRVRAAAGSAWPATLINFAVGFAALVLGSAIAALVRGGPGGELPGQPWLYVGGALGVYNIAVAAAVVRFTGVLLLGLAATAGQVVWALVLDLVAPTDGPPGRNTYAGAVLTLVAVGIAATPRLRRRAAGPARVAPRER
jgi:transporter family-2 protein